MEDASDQMLIQTRGRGGQGGGDSTSVEGLFDSTPVE
jgi:hypothetical protein